MHKEEIMVSAKIARAAKLQQIHAGGGNWKGWTSGGGGSGQTLIIIGRMSKSRCEAELAGTMGEKSCFASRTRYVGANPKGNQQKMSIGRTDNKMRPVCGNQALSHPGKQREEIHRSRGRPSL